MWKILSARCPFEFPAREEHYMMKKVLENVFFFVEKELFVTALMAQ